MNYSRSVKYILENPKWWLILLIGLLCNFVPIIGMIAFTGYLTHMILEFDKTKVDKLPDFDVNLLGDYLKTGIWPFLGLFIPTFLFMLVYMVFFLGIFGFSFQAQSSKAFAFFPAVIILLNIPMMILVNCIAVPFALGGAYGQTFYSIFNKDFIFDFIKKMWLETIFSLLFVWLVTCVVAFLGFFLCCFGAYLSIPFMMMAQWHMYWQLYEEYLRRGGIVLTK